MTPLTRLTRTLAVAIPVALVVAVFGVREANAAAKPNILFIAVDDLNDWVG
ncbi:MAG: hypothetical protein JNK76_17170, partial [Planctomycetales bacterium]|nr:hypothetical protein [Planctomycetales bacterium]